MNLQLPSFDDAVCFGIGVRNGIVHGIESFKRSVMKQKFANLFLAWEDELQFKSLTSPCRAAVIAALSGLGVVATPGGLVYLWEFSSGSKLGVLHHFEGNH